MIDVLVEQINMSLKNNCYMTALTTALILPDICGKAKYPDLKNKERYVKWYDEYIGKYEKNSIQNDDMPYLSGKIVWKLRCSLLHEGNPTVNKRDSDIDYFELLWQGYQRCSIVMDSVLVQSNVDGSIVKKEFSVNIIRICNIICSVAKNYYKEYKDTFNFFNYRISNMEKRTRETLRIKYINKNDNI